jgi:hypothetical protein
MSGVTTRVLDPPRMIDPYYHQAQRIAELEGRIALLEQKAVTRSDKYVRVLPSGTTSMEIANRINGDAITGVRISGFLKLLLASSRPFVRLKPNGLSSMGTSAVWQRVYFQTPTQVSDTQFGANSATQAGLILTRGDWPGSATQTATFDGVFFTTTGLGGRRHWIGTATSQDLSVSSNNYLSARAFSWWEDVTTTVTSLTLSVDAGTMEGRVTVEILP